MDKLGFTAFLGHSTGCRSPPSTKKWVVDDEAAEILKRTFNLCVNGVGPTQIAKRLNAENVLTPTAYRAKKD
ncbi:hypothetical protein JCM15765_30710 [Paradesulfitobacterium aromaticivorans]